MALKKFVRLHITGSSDEELQIEDYLTEDGQEMTKEEIEEWAYENAAELLVENDWSMWDVDVRIFEREVPDDAAKS